MAKKNRKPILIYILALVVLYLIIYTIPKLTGMIAPTEILEPGSVQITDDVACYFVRDEMVYAATSAGDIDYLISEGTHIRPKTKVLKIKESKELADKGPQAGESPEDWSDFGSLISTLGTSLVKAENGRARNSGILSYYTDGYEAYFTPEKMKSLTYEKLEDFEIEAEHLKRQQTLAGEPIFKIADNDNWYLVCWVEPGRIGYYNTGEKVTVQLPDGDVVASVSNIKQEGERWQVILKSNNYYKSFAKSRVAEAQIISRDYDGLLVSNSSLTTKDKQPGVMVRQKNGNYAFTRVKIIASDGEYSVLQDVTFTDQNGNSVDTVKVYDEVKKRPGEVQK